MTRKTPNNLSTGQAGVYQVASQLLLRGFNPLFPSVDHGADLIVEGGVRIQVKSGRIRRLKNAKFYYDGCYWLTLARTKVIRYAVGERVQRGVKIEDWTEFCDVVIFWGITENRFWIIPSRLLNGRQCLILGPTSGRHVDLDVGRINELLDQGKTQEEVALSMGVTQMTISRRTRGQHITGQRNFYKEIRSYENRWDVIGEFLNADSLVSTSLLSLQNNLKED